MDARPTVLVVNNSRALLDSLSEVLEAEGYEAHGVRCADLLAGRHSPREVLARLRPQLVLFDVSFPYELCWSAYRHLAPALAEARVPVQFVTAVRLGAEPYTGPDVLAFMFQPQQLAALLRRVRQVLGPRRPAASAERAAPHGLPAAG